MRLGLQHTYAALPARFHARVIPTAVPDPKLVVFNSDLARELDLDPDVLEPQAAALFSGNRLPEDAEPIAMAYAGHQFGGFVPSLGDGRAILLGEIKARDGTLRDIQLKGAGLTPFHDRGVEAGAGALSGRCDRRGCAAGRTHDRSEGNRRVHCLGSDRSAGRSRAAGSADHRLDAAYGNRAQDGSRLGRTCGGSAGRALNGRGGDPCYAGGTRGGLRPAR